MVETKYLCHNPFNSAHLFTDINVARLLKLRIINMGGLVNVNMGRFSKRLGKRISKYKVSVNFTHQNNLFL
jgi:hypothetical protein